MFVVVVFVMLIACANVGDFAAGALVVAAVVKCRFVPP